MSLALPLIVKEKFSQGWLTSLSRCSNALEVLSVFKVHILSFYMAQNPKVPTKLGDTLTAYLEQVLH